MWQPLRRGSNSKFRWNARSHSLPEKSSGANKSLQPGPLLLDCSFPLLYNARITKPLDAVVGFTVVINAERDLRLNMNQTLCKYCHLLACRVNCTCYMLFLNMKTTSVYSLLLIFTQPTLTWVLSLFSHHHTYMKRCESFSRCQQDFPHYCRNVFVILVRGGTTVVLIKKYSLKDVLPQLTRKVGSDCR